MLTTQGPRVLCFVDSRRFSTLYRGGSCAICTGQARVMIIGLDVCALRIR